MHIGFRVQGLGFPGLGLYLFICFTSGCFIHGLRNACLTAILASACIFRIARNLICGLQDCLGTAALPWYDNWAQAITCLLAWNILGPPSLGSLQWALRDLDGSGQSLCLVPFGSRFRVRSCSHGVNPQPQAPKQNAGRRDLKSIKAKQDMGPQKVLQHKPAKKQAGLPPAEPTSLYRP